MKNTKKFYHLSDQQVKTIDKYFIRISALLLITATILWYIYQLLIDSNLVVYTDFRNIYTGAYMGLHHTGSSMYSLSTQFHIQHHFFSSINGLPWLLPFLTPPFMSLFLSPLALFSIKTAYLIWGTFNCGILLILCFFTNVILHTFRWQVRYFIIGLMLTFIPVWEAILQGQLSFLLILSLFFGWYCITKKKEFSGGVVLSLFVIKPHFIFLLLLFLLLKRRKALYGLLIGLSILFLISLAFVSIDGMKNYTLLLMHISNWGEAYGMHPKIENTWGGLLDSYFHANILKAVFYPWIIGVCLAVGLFIWTIWSEEGNNTFDLQFALLILLTVFIGPHVFMHDLSILIVAGIAIAHYLIRYNMPALQKKLLLFIPISGYLLAMIDYLLLWNHKFVHLVVWWMIVSMVIVFNFCREKHRA